MVLDEHKKVMLKRMVTYSKQHGQRQDFLKALADYVRGNDVPLSVQKRNVCAMMDGVQDPDGRLSSLLDTTGVLHEDAPVEEDLEVVSEAKIEMIVKRQTSTMITRRQTSTVVADDSDGEEDSVQL